MAEEELQMVVFSLKADDSICEYGVPITQVQEIIRMTVPTKLPKAPSFVEGVINLRGKVIPVIDMKKRFEIEADKYTDNTRIIVADMAGRTVGMMVDEVNEVLRIPMSDVEPSSSLVGGITAEYLRGVGKLGERLLILLDLHKILSVDESEELELIA